jgi:hypothetical protein
MVHRLHKALSCGRPAPRAEAFALLAAVLALAVLLPSSALGAPSTGASKQPVVNSESLFHSRLLWATIDVCSAPDQPDTLGIRGSMPGDSQARDTMYMRFRMQYMNMTTKQWADLKGTISDFASVGSGAAARQAGRSFQLSPVAGQPAFTLRGVVSFQWRHGTSVVAQTSRPTSAGRHSLAGSDPVGFSTATCLIG